MGHEPEDFRRAATTEALPVAPSLGPTLEAASVPSQVPIVDGRVVWVSALATLTALATGAVAQGLTRLIGLITNLAFYGRVSSAFSSPADNRLGVAVIAVPVVGAIVVGLMARYGSKAIRGHGIPEAMEQVLTNQSRIPARLTFLKPLSAAISIGTGGPFGAEGPIIATGGALGSVVGQVLRTTAAERKTLLAAGAAAGMAATFGSPVSAVLLAVELLLFEFSPRSLIPVALAASAATGVRIAFAGSAPVFGMPDVAQPGGAALATYVVVGALVGLASIAITRLVYAVEDGFEKLPIHWMWWPALGAVAVGVCGYFAPRTLGVGYDNIEHILAAGVVGGPLAFLCGMKLVSWAISLGSGTSGGTLAPLFTIGGGLGALLGAAAAAVLPSFGVDARIAALVGMAAMFAGASRAFLASVVFAFETTRQPLGLLPLLGGCAAAYLMSCLFMRHSIMTEKIARRGVRVVAEYAADYLETVLVADRMSREVATLGAGQSLASVRAFLAGGGATAGHTGYPVVDDGGTLVGVVTRAELLDPSRPGATTVAALVRRAPAVVFDDSSLREAADHMVREDVGRLPVVRRAEPRRLVGFLTRSDLLAAHRRRLAERHVAG
jgi:H+/Cl- antiporter ClcA/CBS domain-containing protein